MPSPNSVSLEDIAKVAGVTRNAVSLALRNRPGVSKETRRRIKDIADSLDYRPNPMVTALMNTIRSSRPVQSQGNLAFFQLTNTEHEWRQRAYYSHIYEGIEARCQQTGFTVTPFWLRNPAMTRERLSQVLKARGINGIIIGSTEVSQRHIKFPWDDFAVAAIGLSLWRPKVHRVHSDMRQCMSMAVTQLRKLKYKRIGIAYSYISDSRFDFAWSSASSSEFAKHPDCLCRPYFVKDNSTQGFDIWLEQEKPDVVIDATLTNLHKELQDRGYDIPKDIGYVDIVRHKRDVQIATVYRNLPAIGEAAVDLVSSQLMRNERGIPKNRYSLVIEGNWSPGTTVHKQV